MFVYFNWISVPIKLVFKETNIKCGHILILLYRPVLVKEIQSFVTWFCFLHQSQAWILLGLARQMKAWHILGDKNQLHVTDQTEQVSHIPLMTQVDPNSKRKEEEKTVSLTKTILLQMFKIRVSLRYLNSLQRCCQKFVFWDVRPCVRK